MRRSKRIEQFILIDLLIAGLSHAIPALNSEYEYVAKPIKMITYFIFTCMFCYKFWYININLTDFFEKLCDHSYPTKTIKVVLAVFFVVRINWIIESTIGIWWTPNEYYVKISDALSPLNA